MRLEVQEVVCAELGEDMIEGFGIGLEEEEFLPEAFGFLDFIFFLSGVSAVGRRVMSHWKVP